MLIRARRRPRAPSIVHAAVVLVALCLIAFFAVTRRETPPPSIAEFAPQAVQEITDSPADQARDQLGGGSTTGAGEAIKDAQSAADTSLQAPRHRRCVGDPPRQIEDPQSPPCVPYWSGNNGGNTARGVTTDQITVAATPGGQREGSRVLTDLAAFFNNRFEFYGRKLVLAPTPPARGDCAGRRADVQDMTDKLKAFAAIGPEAANHACYSDESGRQRLIQIGVAQFVSEAELESGRPALWAYSMSFDELLANWGRWTCKRLANERATFSRDPTIASRPRTFGLIVQYQYTPFAIDLGPIERELQQCGSPLKASHVLMNGAGDPASNAVRAIIDLKSKNVTTVLCFCPVFASQFVSNAATGQAYLPEWNATDPMSRNIAIKTFWPNSEQRQSLLGYMTYPQQVPYADSSINWALAETDPGFQVESSLELLAQNTIYWQFLLLASGIQLAGPTLTPATFERGLLAARFPNASTPPVQEGWVGFPARQHDMIHDGYGAWWSESAPSPYVDEGAGAWCYAEAGRRRKLHEWVTEPSHLFEPPCVNSPV